MEIKSALVTGGAGFIASHLVDRLVTMGGQVKIIDNISSGSLENLKNHLKKETIDLVKGDLKDYNTTLKVVKDVDVVFHFAANPEVRLSTTHPKIHFSENIVSTFHLLEAMRENNVPDVIFASSSSVYGEPESIPVNEQAQIRPVSVYGASKGACENLMYAYSSLYGLKTVILRYGNVIGSRLRHGVIYDLLFKLLKDERKLEVLGDGTQIRGFVNIDDALDATLLAYERTATGTETYNVASEDWVSVNDIIEILLAELHLSETSIAFKPILHGVGWRGDVKKIALTIDKIKQLGFKPQYTSKEAIKQTIYALNKELPL